MQPSQVVLLLTLLLGVQPITTDLYLPALPAIADGLGATMGQTQLTLTALLLAFGTSQLVWGPLSDRFGRKPILIIGMAAYATASMGSVFAATIDTLITWRAVQGVAMGAAVMCARAMTRDLYDPVEGTKVMSKGLTGLGVIACLSAPLGGLLSDWFGWRMAMVSLSVFGAVTLAMVVWRFEESLKHRNPLALQPATLVRTWAAIVRNPTFWAYALLATCSYGGLFTFLATSSFVFIKVLGLSKTQYGLVMSSMSFSYIIGTFMCRSLLLRFGVQRTVLLGGWLTLVAGVLLAALAANGVQAVWAIMGPFYIFMLGHGGTSRAGSRVLRGRFRRRRVRRLRWRGFL
jgi:MFS transporter, DHA1 family, multidrug resistance protein